MYSSWNHIYIVTNSNFSRKTEKILTENLLFVCIILNIALTVAVVAGIDAAFKSLHLCKLGQHLSEGAAALVSCRAWAFVNAVISLWKLQR